jgi:hypothetical protein
MMQILTTVLTPAGTSALTTWEEVKLELGLPDSDQAWAESAITRMSSLIASYCDRVFGVRSIQDDFVPNEGSRNSWIGSREPLVLSTWPVTAVTSVTVDGTALVADTDYRLDGDDGLLYRLDSDGGIAHWERQPVRAVYSAGYVLPADNGYLAGSDASLPAELVDAALSLVSGKYFSRRRDPLLRSENVPDVGAAAYWVGSIGDDAMPANITAILDSYRARPI